MALAALGFHVGVVFAVGHRGAAAFTRVAQAQVDDAGDGVRAVLRGGAVAQHFDGFERRQRNGIEIDRRRAATHRAIHVDQRGLVPALAVHQHQGLVGRQAAQRGGADVVGAVGDRGSRKIQRWRGGREGLGEFGAARGGQRFLRQNIDRRERIEARTRGDACAGHHHLVDVSFFVGRGRSLRHELRTCANAERGSNGCAQGKRAETAEIFHGDSFLELFGNSCVATVECPPVRYFKSDNTAAVSEEILRAIPEANTGVALAYGADRWSESLDAVYGEFFGTKVRVFAVSSGTAANSLALATFCPPWGTVLTHAEAHIERDECGAPEFFTGGAKLSLVGGAGAKITPADLLARLSWFEPHVHGVQPRMLSITQATERGAIYTPQEISALSKIAHERGMTVHMDGARFANALVAQKVSAAELTWKAGVDVLSFGVIKNGGMNAEAVVFFDPTRVADFEFRRKRAGQLFCKGRYAAVQLLAYLESGMWRRNAERANRLASRIAAAAPAVAERAVRDQPGVHASWAKRASRRCRKSSASIPGVRPVRAKRASCVPGTRPRKTSTRCAPRSAEVA